MDERTPTQPPHETPETTALPTVPAHAGQQTDDDQAGHPAYPMAGQAPTWPVAGEASPTTPYAVPGPFAPGSGEPSAWGRPEGAPAPRPGSALARFGSVVAAVVLAGVCVPALAVGVARVMTRTAEAQQPLDGVPVWLPVVVLAAVVFTVGVAAVSTRMSGVGPVLAALPLLALGGAMFSPGAQEGVLRMLWRVTLGSDLGYDLVSVLRPSIGLVGAVCLALGLASAVAARRRRRLGLRDLPVAVLSGVVMVAGLGVASWGLERSGRYTAATFDATAWLRDPAVVAAMLGGVALVLVAGLAGGFDPRGLVVVGAAVLCLALLVVAVPGAVVDVTPSWVWVAVDPVHLAVAGAVLLGGSLGVWARRRSAGRSWEMHRAMTADPQPSPVVVHA